LKVLPEDGNESATATIEFESKEDVLTAQTKDMKIFDGNPIEVQVGTGSTLFVTNFTPTADEGEIRELFAKVTPASFYVPDGFTNTFQFGEVVDIRFPSLQKNTHRRFCYVQFKSSHEAQAATKLDGTTVGGKHKLIVKISNPERKHARSGALYEGRELHLVNLDWSATEDEVQKTFAKYGTVERVRIPRDLAGKSKGFGFVVFSRKVHGTRDLFDGRILIF
jgi:RNA recognition motif-containing protein